MNFSRSLLLLAIAAPLHAQADAKVKAAAQTIVAANLMRDVSYLASDALKGRGTPSPGLDSAAAYFVRRLTQLRIKPIGDDNSYFQHYTVVRATLDTMRTTMRSGTQTFVYGTDFLVNSFLSAGMHTGKVVYVGTGIRALTRGLDPYAGINVRDKWILVHASQIRPRNVTTDSLGVVGRDYTTALDEARSRGALGLLFIPTPQQVANWSATRKRVPTGQELSPVVGRAYAAYPLPQLTLSFAALDRLLGDKGAEVLASDSLHRYPASFEIGALAAEVAATTTSIRASNVVALVDGSDPVLRSEWVTISTHLDGAVGRGATVSGDSIYNAADDNASGSAGNLSIAHALMTGPRPKRSMLLIWDSGEETGLWGSRFLAYGPLAKNVVAHFTVDMIARTRKPGTNIKEQEELSGPGEVFVSGPLILSTALESAIGKASRDYGYVHLDRRYEDPKHEFFYPRTDAAPYIEQGIPYAEFFTGLHEDYHRQTDEVSKLDPVKFEAVARMVYVTAWTVANGKERPRIDKPVPPVLWFMTPR